MSVISSANEWFRRMDATSLAARDLLRDTRAALAAVEPPPLPDVPPGRGQAAHVIRALRENAQAVVERRRNEIRAMALERLREIQADHRRAEEAVTFLRDRTLRGSVPVDPLDWEAARDVLDQAGDKRAQAVQALAEQAIDNGDTGVLRAIRRMGPSYFRARGDQWPEELTRQIDLNGGGPKDAKEAWAVADRMKTAAAISHYALPAVEAELSTHPFDRGQPVSVLPTTDGGAIPVDDVGREAVRIVSGA